MNGADGASEDGCQCVPTGICDAEYDRREIHDRTHPTCIPERKGREQRENQYADGKIREPPFEREGRHRPEPKSLAESGHGWVVDK